MASKNKVISLKDLKSLVKEWKKQGLKVVFTNGCFDILHLGHIDYLEKSKQKGDKLIVGLNSDRSVSILKGQGRPVMDEISRSRLLSSLEFVDAVTLFDQQTPYELICEVVPDILVKGNDYKPEDIVGHDVVLKHGGSVETIDLVKGYSTTAIIEKIKNL